VREVGHAQGDAWECGVMVTVVAGRWYEGYVWRKEGAGAG